MKLRLAFAAFVALLSLGRDADAQATFEVVGTFPQHLGLPAYGLVETSDGAHYGIARFGGTGDAGSLFKVNEVTNSVSEVASFATIGGEIGSERLGLAVDTTGKIFGVTPYGGATGDGTVWSWSSTGGLVKLANFNALTTGENPHCNVIWDNDTLYGVCESGGQYNAGTLWKWTSTAGVVRLFSFQNYGDALSLGGRPQWIALNGTTLYGVTLERDPGGFDIPVLWARSAAGVMSQAAVFDTDSAGYPLGPLVVCDTGIAGISYSNQATRSGTNRLWRYTGNRTLSIAKSFPTTEQDVSIGTRDGFEIFGTTSTGKVWSWAPDAPYTSLGTIPVAIGEPGGEIAVTTDGELFGTALKGTDGAGTVWHWSASATDVVATFEALPMGGDPNGIWMDEAGSVFGVETIKQLIWRWSPATGSTPTQIGDVENPLIGFVTFGNVVGDGTGNLFGFTRLGVAGNAGVLWCWNAQKGLVKLGNFGTSAVPGNATGAIACDQDGNVFGTTEQVISNVKRTHLWCWNSADGLDRVATLDVTEGGAPTHTLITNADGSALYGTCTTGGANNKGTLWAWTANDGVIKLADFGTPSTITSPGEGLAVSPFGVVYGVTTTGGATGDGRIWKWVSVSGLSAVKDFERDTTGTMIDTDDTGMIFASDGKLYGTTQNGGANGVGTLWSCNISGTPAITALKHFDPTQLSHPSAQRLVQGDDGMIYGLALHGIWRYGVATSSPTAPAAVTLAASYTSASRVVMEGSVNARGVNTTISFEYGTAADDLSETRPSTPALATGNTAMPCSLELTDLLPNTSYYYRVKATNANGTTYGDIAMVKTTVIVNPIIVTKPATGVGVNGLMLNGLLTLKSDIDTTTGFLLGTSATALTTVINSATISDATATPFTASATGLLAHTRYYFRASATNDNGTALGAVLSATTLNTTPTTTDDNATVLPSGSVRIAVTTNDHDADSDALSLLNFTQPGSNAGRVTKDGTALIFTATTTFTSATFRYTISDGFGGTASANVNVTRGTASLNPPTKTLSSAGGSYTVNVTTSSSWAAISGASWINVSPAGGTGNGSITLSVNTNTAVTARIGTVVIGGIAHTLTQNGVVLPTLTVPSSIPEGIISGGYQLSIPTTGQPVIYSTTNLPPGLRITSTGTIEGTPTRASTYFVTIKATNAAGTASISFPIKINALPDNAVGAFSALFERHALNNQLGGLLTFNATSAGTLTGTLRCGNMTYSLNDRVDGWQGGTAPCSASIDIPRTGTTALRLAIAFGATTLDQTITCTLHAISSSSVIPPADIAHATGARHTFGGTSASAYAGTFNSVLDLTSNLSNPAVPQGSGYVIHKTAAAGTTTWSGKLSDGTAIAGSASLWPNGSVPMWQLLYTNTGSVFGSPRFAIPTGEVTGTLDWLRKPQSPTERKYRLGFGPLVIAVNGSRYTQPASFLSMLALNDTADNARLRFFEGALSTSEQGASVNQVLRISSLNTALLAGAGSANNLTSVKLSLAPTTGIFTGSFTLRDSNVLVPSKPYMRTVNFEGLVVPGLSKGAGYFLLSGLASDPNWTTLSGQVVLDAKP